MDRLVRQDSKDKTGIPNRRDCIDRTNRTGKTDRTVRTYKIERTHMADWTDCTDRTTGQTGQIRFFQADELSETLYIRENLRDKRTEVDI